MIFAKDKDYIIYRGSCLDILDTLPENSVDAIVTDPPYEIGFMSKGWDNTGIAFNPKTWQKCLRVLKPGGHILAFNHSRTFHRMAVAIEDAGFEIRDTIMWLYGSGFPKSYDIAKGIEGKLTNGSASWNDFHKLNGKLEVSQSQGSNGLVKLNKEQGNRPKQYESHGKLELEATTEEAKQWQGWGSALKPAYEPIILARKPLQGTIAQNVLKWGVGGINVDECRVEFGSESDGRVGTETKNNTNKGFWQKEGLEGVQMYKDNGRFPANVMHDGSDEVVSLFPDSDGAGGSIPNNKITGYGKNIGDGTYEYYGGDRKVFESGSGTAARFFYVAKASKKDRDEGLSEFEENQTTDGCIRSNPESARKFGANSALRKNIHPTVKPTDLMQYLIRLIMPKGGTILDPFMGSGSTGKAAMIENNERNADYHFIGIDLEQEYCEIAQARIEFGVNYREELAKIEEAEKIAEGQINMFDFEATL